MTKNQILTGIHNAECRLQLAAHINRVEHAIDCDECTYDAEQWIDIRDLIVSKMAEFAARVVH